MLPPLITLPATAGSSDGNTLVGITRPSWHSSVSAPVTLTVQSVAAALWRRLFNKPTSRTPFMLCWCELRSTFSFRSFGITAGDTVQFPEQNCRDSRQVQLPSVRHNSRELGERSVKSFSVLNFPSTRGDRGDTSLSLDEVKSTTICKFSPPAAEAETSADCRCTLSAGWTSVSTRSLFAGLSSFWMQFAAESLLLLSSYNKSDRTHYYFRQRTFSLRHLQIIY